jgi:hypothetical protein
MEQFSGYTIYWSGYVLESLITDTFLKGESGLGNIPVPTQAFHQPLDIETMQKAIDALRQVEAEFRKIGLQDYSGHRLRASAGT